MHLKNNKRNTATTIVHIASGDLWAGAEVQLYNIAKELHKHKQVRLFIVLLNHGILENKLEKAGISIKVFDEKELNSLQIFLRISAFLKSISVDIVHTHRQKENVLGSFSALVSRARRSLRTVHGAPESRHGLMKIHKHLYIFMDWLTGRLLQDRIVAVSTQLADQLANQFPKNRIHVIENGIDLDELRISATEDTSLPGPSDSIKLAIVGRLVPIKRLDIFLDIARILVDQNPNRYAFYIFGDGPLHADIANRIEKLGLRHCVHMMGFQVNIAAYLSKMDFLLITSDHEGLPMVLLEAMALRVPVITRAVGGIPVVLDHGKCGVLVTTNDPNVYAEIIMHYLSHADQLTALVQRGHQRLLDLYTVQRAAALYYQLYLEMLS